MAKSSCVARTHFFVFGSIHEAHFWRGVHWLSFRVLASRLEAHSFALSEVCRDLKSSDAADNASRTATAKRNVSPDLRHLAKTSYRIGHVYLSSVCVQHRVGL